MPAGCCCPNTGARFNGLWEQGQRDRFAERGDDRLDRDLLPLEVDEAARDARGGGLAGVKQGIGASRRRGGVHQQEHVFQAELGQGIHQRGTGPQVVGVSLSGVKKSV